MMETAAMNTTKVKMQRYPVYKDSGEEWFENIPEQWGVKPGFTIVSERNEKNIGLKENQVLSLSYGSIVIKPEEKLTGLVPASFETYQIVYPGDIIIRTMDLQNDKTSLRVGFANDKGIISSAYLNLNVRKDYDAKYYYYFLHNIDITKIIYGLGSGLRQNLSYLDFKRFYFLVPSPDEQTLIADFLDRKTAQIDQAIAQKERQIELLKERRQIIIHNAVTRGLNPNVKMKDSGVEWIGEIPEHWEVKRIKTLSRVKRGASPRPIDDPRYFNEDGEFAWVRIADVSANDHYLTNTVQQLSKLGSSLSVKIFPNELFVSIAGTVGKPMISKIKCCIHDGFVYFPDLKINIEYLYRIFETGQPYLGLGKHGTQLNLNTETIGSIYMPTPPDDEQSSIVNHVENTCQKLNKTISLKQQEIEKLKEYKATLINAAVTGKIKV